MRIIYQEIAYIEETVWNACRGRSGLFPMRRLRPEVLQMPIEEGIEI